jgi:two-component system phosphate regulon response regulator PhoB
MAAKSPLVMVVDDERHICNVLRRILQKDGYRVITAPDGETALGLIPEKKPDVILLDLVMPTMNGREVCHRVRESSADTKIIYFSAKVNATESSKAKEFHHEADAFIAKPASSRRILSSIRNVLNSPGR